MITARQYEDKMIELSEEYKEHPDTMQNLMIKLMMDALECHGYTAGNRIYQDRLKAGSMTELDFMA